MSAPPRQAERELLWLALASLAWLAATAWARPLMLPDEGRYVGVAWEMLRSGSWLTPTLDGLPYFHKPPLFYWITAGALWIFGANEWAARAAPLLGAWAAAMATYAFVQRWWSVQASRVSLVVLLAQPLFFIGGQFANLDMLVAGCITVTILLLVHTVLCAEREQLHHWPLLGAYAAAAAGLLAKGLIGFVIPALVVAAWLLATRRWRGFRIVLWWPAILLFVMIAAPWFVSMHMRFPDFLHYFFVVQHFQRFAADGFNNVQPFWFFVAVLLLFTLPWWPWLYRALRRGAATKVRHVPRDTALRTLMLIWVAVVLVFFSLPKSKLLGYVLPAMPPLAMLVAYGLLAAGSPSRKAERGWQAATALGALVGLGAVIAIAVGGRHSTHELAETLGAQHAADEPVYMLGQYYFDVPFYARLPAPVAVVDDWSATAVRSRDNWRQELADAAQFAPARAASLLIAPADLMPALCQQPVSWVVGPDDAVTRFPFLAAAHVHFAHAGTRLWHIDRHLTDMADSALNCEGRPNAGPADR